MARGSIGIVESVGAGSKDGVQRAFSLTRSPTYSQGHFRDCESVGVSCNRLGAKSISTN